VKPKHHEIEIAVIGKTVRQPSPMPELSVGDTVRYFSKHDGKLVIVFPERSPYRSDNRVNTQVTDTETVTLARDGVFPSGCQLELADGTVMGWNPRDPLGTKDSGGDHDVRKPP
jgi:hypothetical protein